MFGAGHFSCSVSPETFRRDRLPTGDRFREATCTDSQWRSCDLSSHLSTSEVRALSAENTPLPLVSVCRAQKGGLGAGRARGSELPSAAVESLQAAVGGAKAKG